MERQKVYSIYPDSYIEDDTLYLHLKNAWSASAVIYKVEVSGLGEVTSASVPGSTPPQGIATGGGATVTISLDAEETVIFK